MMHRELPKKRVCLLVGARSRLGRAFCKAFARDYEIVGVHRREPFDAVPTQESRFVDPLDPSKPMSRNEDPIHAIRADLSDPAQVSRVVEIALARFGTIDLVLNTAVHRDHGLLINNERVVKSAMPQLWLNAVLPMELAVHIAKECWRDRPDENRARNRNVVNLSAMPTTEAGHSIYWATKAALESFTKSLAVEFQSFNVRVNALAPAPFTETLTPAKVAEAVRQLEGDAAVNGTIAVVDDKGFRIEGSK
jgi:NAD(P)-dependent dehydrogenase (short-subunit alcohol dehydrogenase family)